MNNEKIYGSLISGYFRKTKNNNLKIRFKNLKIDKLNSIERSLFYQVVKKKYFKIIDYNALTKNSPVKIHVLNEKPTKPYLRDLFDSDYSFINSATSIEFPLYADNVIIKCFVFFLDVIDNEHLSSCDKAIQIIYNDLKSIYDTICKKEYKFRYIKMGLYEFKFLNVNEFLDINNAIADIFHTDKNGFFSYGIIKIPFLEMKYNDKVYTSNQDWKKNIYLSLIQFALNSPIKQVKIDKYKGSSKNLEKIHRYEFGKKSLMIFSSQPINSTNIKQGLPSYFDELVISYNNLSYLDRVVVNESIVKYVEALNYMSNMDYYNSILPLIIALENISLYVFYDCNFKHFYLNKDNTDIQSKIKHAVESISGNYPYSKLIKEIYDIRSSIVHTGNLADLENYSIYEYKADRYGELVLLYNFVYGLLVNWIINRYKD